MTVSDLVPANRSLRPSAPARVSGRAVDRIRADQAIISAQEEARIAVISDTTELGLMAAARIAAVQEMLASRSSSPLLDEKLRHIADAGVLNLMDVVVRVGQRVR
jgi:hypothetical protein